jgi:hypothetical protein
MEQESRRITRRCGPNVVNWSKRRGRCRLCVNKVKNHFCVHVVHPSTHPPKHLPVPEETPCIAGRQHFNIVQHLQNFNILLQSHPPCCEFVATCWYPFWWNTPFVNGSMLAVWGWYGWVYIWVYGICCGYGGPAAEFIIIGVCISCKSMHTSSFESWCIISWNYLQYTLYHNQCL